LGTAELCQDSPVAEDRTRRLVFSPSGPSAGWFCEACGWYRPLPLDIDERRLLAARIQAEFDRHDCAAKAHRAAQLARSTRSGQR